MPLVVHAGPSFPPYHSTCRNNTHWNSRMPAMRDGIRDGTTTVGRSGRQFESPHVRLLAHNDLSLICMADMKRAAVRALIRNDKFASR